MSVEIKNFGDDVRSVTVESETGVRAVLLTYGAALQSLSVPTHNGRVETVLGFPDIQSVKDDMHYHAVIVGRYANRIDNGQFEIDNKPYQLSINEGKTTTLHGGKDGFNKALWEVLGQDNSSVKLGHVSENGDQGFPGKLTTSVLFRLTGSELAINYEATTDAPTIVNLTHHSYLNAAGGGDIRSQELQVKANAITPVNAKLIPTGELLAVAGTPFDFRRPRKLGEAFEGKHPQMEISRSKDGFPGVDHNWVLTGEQPAVTLSSRESGVKIEMSTDQPGMQFYSTQGGGPFGRYGGLAAEPQNFPDAPHHSSFPSAELRPGQTYRRQIRMRLTAER